MACIPAASLPDDETVPAGGLIAAAYLLRLLRGERSDAQAVVNALVVAEVGTLHRSRSSLRHSDATWGGVKPVDMSQRLTGNSLSLPRSFCGPFLDAPGVQVIGDPVATGCCHSESCRAWYTGSVSFHALARLMECASPGGQATPVSLWLNRSLMHIPGPPQGYPAGR